MHTVRGLVRTNKLLTRSDQIFHSISKRSTLMKSGSRWPVRMGLRAARGDAARSRGRARYCTVHYFFGELTNECGGHPVLRSAAPFCGSQPTRQMA